MKMDRTNILRLLLGATLAAFVAATAYGDAQKVPPDAASGGGIAASDNVDWTGSHSFLDGTYFSLKDDVDPTKILRFQLSGITAGQTRTITVPDANLTLPTAFIGGSTGATDNAILTADGAGGATLQAATATLDGGALAGLTSVVVKSTGSGTPTIFEVTANTATGAGNLFMGTAAGDSATSLSSSLLVGTNAGTALSTGNNVVAIGYDTVKVSTNLGTTVAVGNSVGSLAYTSDTTCVGHGACLRGAESSVGIGKNSLQNGPQSGNTGLIGIGQDAGNTNAFGDWDYNIWIGHQSGYNNANVYDDCLAMGRSSQCTASNAAHFGSATAPYTSTTSIRSTTGSADVQALNTEAITLSTGGTTTNSSGNIVPASSIIDAIACRVTTTITTATEWGVAVTGRTAFNQIGTTDATVATMTAGTTAIFVPAAYGDQYNATATTITITTTGTPGAGVVRCAVHSRTFTAPTS